MLKEEFNKLEIEKQVEYLNSRLLVKTLTKACDEIKIARSTITGRFKKDGYTLDLTQNKYILDFQENKTLSEDNSSDIKELLEMKDKLKILIEWFDDEQAGAIQNDFNIKLDNFKGEPVSRTFVLYPNVLQNYIKFCVAHRAYRRQDILSKALTEFMDRYE
jgi:hypothetical protein